MLTLLNESLWGDEGFSALAVMKPFIEMMGVVMRDTAPPGFYILGFIWGRLFGFSEVGLRSLSLLLILGAAVFAGLIVKNVSKNNLLAWLTGLLAFFSPFSFSYAFEWRMYALLTFAVMGSIYFFTARKWRGYVILTVLAVYTHHLALFTLAGQVLWFLLTEFDWKQWKSFIKQLWPFWLVGVFYLPWCYPMYLQTTRVQGAGFWLKAPTIEEVLGLMGRFITGGVVKKWRLSVAVMAGILLIGKGWKKIGKKWLEILIIIMMPIFLSCLVSYLVTPVFYDRYLLSVVVGIPVLLIIGSKKWQLPIMIFLVVVYGYCSYQLFIHPKKRPFRDLAAYVKSELKEGDYLLNYNGRAHHLWETKYYGIAAPIYVPEGELPLYVGTAQMTDQDISRGVPEWVKRVGAVTSEPVEKVNLEERWHRGDFKEFGELKLVWFEKND